ncbi:saccharopine dehydrogenase family protein [Actinophytocola sp.]|uniref:saccharopine dehydrogenase family protein n=1 Tax=Actinophytocola sp. TaxID=1872138 RepID=UPI002D701FDE|nr:saccharopine dehydrogenase NADP-binding domain-containing protein [Actinophytocola sp.]HYQ67425.1 saccharopine dehydrogenase NADP-binding domain-containing protein [Actinophytocola sp.]
MSVGREFDVVLFGATGFTGQLTAEYLAEHAPNACRWALAGRSREKLLAVRERLAEINPSCADLDLLIADVTDRDSLRAVASRARVIATTVGPYLHHGEPLVAVCAETGTDYLDLSGEPEFVDRMYLAYHDVAVASRARIVHAAGFDSVPHDLGVLFTVQQLPEDVPLAVEGYLSLSGAFSAGTYHSAINAFSRLREMSAVAKRRRRAEPRPDGRSVKGVKGRPRFEEAVGAWLLPAPTIDPQVVLRSARALDRYGPAFTYGHYLAVRKLPAAAGIAGAVGAAVVLAQVPFTRNWLLGRMAAGDGPTAERRDKAWFRVRFVGEGGGRRVVTEVSGGDPGYGETAKMLGESALCLAFDDLPKTAGQVTPAVAMGSRLVDRLGRAGLTFRVVE